MFIIYIGSIYEGGITLPVAYRNIDSARQDAISEVKKAQKEQEETYNILDPEDKPDFLSDWYEADKNHWTNGIEEIRINILTVY